MTITGPDDKGGVGALSRCGHWIVSHHDGDQSPVPVSYFRSVVKNILGHHPWPFRSLSHLPSYCVAGRTLSRQSYVASWSTLRRYTLMLRVRMVWPSPSCFPRRSDIFRSHALASIFRSFSFMVGLLLAFPVQKFPAAHRAV